MKKINIPTILSSILISGTLALTASTATYAAENASGVVHFMNMTIKAVKEARDAATAGNKEDCLDRIKVTKQYYKEITGDAAGKPLQDAMKRVKEAQAECDSGNTANAATILGEVGASMQQIENNMK
jgi:hypothetical protein